MQIYPAVHYVMGGLWVDYNLMTTIPGLFAIGEANFSDHGANRLGASALMQGLGDGYFILPYTLGNYLAGTQLEPVNSNLPEFTNSTKQVEEYTCQLLAIKGQKTAATFHRELGLILWDEVGMLRTAEGLQTAIDRIQSLRSEFWQNLLITGASNTINYQLELAGRVADFLELGELMARDALARNESCGAHFRDEFQTADGEAQRNDREYSYVAVWQYNGREQIPVCDREYLTFDNIQLTQRSYQ
jgi:succinate dehydrogenase / fumarate reductase flavoprotein subunit